jgi:hypothetical protein
MILPETATPPRLPMTGSVPNMSTPTSYNPGYPVSGVASVPAPDARATDTQSLPMFNPSQGNSDSGVGHSGDLGGAGSK